VRRQWAKRDAGHHAVQQLLRVLLHRVMLLTGSRLMKLKRRARMKRMRQARRSACKLGAVSDEFDFFSTDSNNWNYNEFINTPNADRYNKNAL
jgi:hypothetical protein